MCGVRQRFYARIEAVFEIAGVDAGHLGVNVGPDATVGVLRQGAGERSFDVVAAPGRVMAQCEERTSDHSTGIAFEVGGGLAKLAEIALFVGEVAPAAWPVVANEAVDTEFRNGELKTLEGQAAQDLVFQAMDVPVVQAAGSPQIGHAVLMQGDDVSVGFSMSHGRIEQPPVRQPRGFGQVGVADAEAEERTAVTAIGMLRFRQAHTFQFEAVEERKAVSILQDFVGELPVVYVG